MLRRHGYLSRCVLSPQTNETVASVVHQKVSIKNIHNIRGLYPRRSNSEIRFWFRPLRPQVSNRFSLPITPQIDGRIHKANHIFQLSLSTIKTTQTTTMEQDNHKATEDAIKAMEAKVNKLWIDNQNDFKAMEDELDQLWKNRKIPPVEEIANMMWETRDEIEKLTKSGQHAEAARKTFNKDRAKKKLRTKKSLS